MAGTKIVTRKLVPWHGRDEEFSNVYYFGDGSAGLSPSESEATDLINAVIAAEKAITHSRIRFLGGASYKIGISDTPGDTDAIAVVELAATGNNGSLNAGTGNEIVDPESAVDFKWLLGGRRYLRTLIHTGLSHGYDVGRATALAVSSMATPLTTYAQKMLNGTWVHGYERIAPNGDRPTVIQYNTFLEHRQFHRYRRRNAGLLG